jgi:outer membrane protein
MKKILGGLIVFLVIAFAGLPAQAQDVRIAYIDAQRLILESAPGKEAASKMEKLQKEKQAQLDKIELNIKKLAEQLSAKSPAMSEKAKADLDDQYQQELKNRERFLKDAQEELRKKEASLIKPIRDDLDKIISDYGKKNALDIIFDSKMPGLIYASDRIDITKPILDNYNKQVQEKAGQTAQPKGTGEKERKKP